ncbi:MAG: exodeoxyribonuclease VII small subunit [Prevotellaceae bacterium]|jgi:exodeoxyribonuclease VII small subunit|nr:exodeoxyribonuclease VII small subunit [Prevotellaceae bacterium]
MGKKRETYKDAVERLETIVRQIESNELDIDVLEERLKEANILIDFCERKLTKAESEIEKLLADTAVATGKPAGEQTK